MSKAVTQCVLLLLLWITLPGYAATVEYIHTDAQGTVVAVSNAAGAVIARREYEPYGRQLQPTTPIDGPGYTGHVMDAATGLVQMQQRYYDPGIGRFLSVDPISVNTTTGVNFGRYNYANNNPYRFTDPDGRQTIPLENRIGTDNPAIIQDVQQAQGELSIAILKIAGNMFLSQFSDGPGGAVAAGPVAVVKEASALARAKEIQGALSPRTQRAVTTAVAETEEGVRVVASSEGKLRPAQKAALQAGEIAPAGAKGVHAEVNAVNGAKKAGLTPTSVSPSRPACASCQDAMKKLDVRIKDK